MAIAFVQGKAAQVASNATNNQCVFGSNNTGGNSIVLAFIYDIATSVSSVTDTRSNNYVSDANQTNIFSAFTLQFYHASNINAGANTITVVVAGGTPNFFTVLAAEFSGLGTYQASSLANASGNSASPTVNVAPTNANQLIIAYGGGSANITAGSNYAAAATPSPTTGDVLIYRVAPSSGSQAVNFTQTSGSWNVTGVSYLVGNQDSVTLGQNFEIAIV